MRHKKEIDLEEMKEHLRSDKFECPEGFLDQSKMNLKNIPSEFPTSEFEVPQNFLVDSKEDLKRIPRDLKRKGAGKMIWFVGGVAAILALIFLLNIETEEPCESFACLLENTEISAEDLEVLDDLDSAIDIDEY